MLKSPANKGFRKYRFLRVYENGHLLYEIVRNRRKSWNESVPGNFIELTVYEAIQLLMHQLQHQRSSF